MIVDLNQALVNVKITSGRRALNVGDATDKECRNAKRPL